MLYIIRNSLHEVHMFTSRQPTKQNLETPPLYPWIPNFVCVNHWCTSKLMLVHEYNLWKSSPRLVEILWSARTAEEQNIVWSNCWHNLIVSIIDQARWTLPYLLYYKSGLFSTLALYPKGQLIILCLENFVKHMVNNSFIFLSLAHIRNTINIYDDMSSKNILYIILLFILYHKIKWPPYIYYFFTNFGLWPNAHRNQQLLCCTRAHRDFYYLSSGMIGNHRSLLVQQSAALWISIWFVLFLCEKTQLLKMLVRNV